MVRLVEPGGRQGPAGLVVDGPSTTIRLKNAAYTVLTNSVPVTIASTPGAPVLLNIYNAWSGGVATTTLNTGQQFLIEADGTGSAGTTFHWTRVAIDDVTVGAHKRTGGPTGRVGTRRHRPSWRDSRGVDTEGHDDYARGYERTKQRNRRDSASAVEGRDRQLSDGGGETRRRIREDDLPADDRRRYAALERPAVIRRVLGLAHELRAIDRHRQIGREDRDVGRRAR